MEEELKGSDQELSKEDKSLPYGFPATSRSLLPNIGKPVAGLIVVWKSS